MLLESEEMPFTLEPNWVHPWPQGNYWFLRRSLMRSGLWGGLHAWMFALILSFRLNLSILLHLPVKWHRLALELFIYSRLYYQHFNGSVGRSVSLLNVCICHQPRPMFFSTQGEKPNLLDCTSLKNVQQAAKGKFYSIFICRVVVVLLLHTVHGGDRFLLTAWTDFYIHEQI